MEPVSGELKLEDVICKKCGQLPSLGKPHDCANLDNVDLLALSLDEAQMKKRQSDLDKAASSLGAISKGLNDIAQMFNEVVKLVGQGDVNRRLYGTTYASAAVERAFLITRGANEELQDIRKGLGKDLSAVQEKIRAAQPSTQGVWATFKKVADSSKPGHYTAQLDDMQVVKKPYKKPRMKSFNSTEAEARNRTRKKNSPTRG